MSFKADIPRRRVTLDLENGHRWELMINDIQSTEDELVLYIHRFGPAKTQYTNMTRLALRPDRNEKLKISRRCYR